MTIKLAESPEDIAKCWDVVRALRPHLVQEEFVSLVQQLQTEGYHLAFVEVDGVAVSAIGYRYLHFLFCGKHTGRRFRI